MRAHAILIPSVNSVKKMKGAHPSGVRKAWAPAAQPASARSSVSSATCQKPAIVPVIKTSASASVAVGDHDDSDELETHSVEQYDNGEISEARTTKRASSARSLMS